MLQIGCTAPHNQKALTLRLVVSAGQVIEREYLAVHDLRAVGATFAARAGATTKELMARLGHTTPRMAMRYQMAAEARDEALAKRMTDLVNDKNPPG